MRRIVLLGLAGLAATSMCAQRHGMMGVGFTRAGSIPHRTPYVPLRGGYRAGYGYGYLPYDEGAGYFAYPAPATVVVQPPEPAPVLEPPPREVHPAITEYKQWGAAAVVPAADGQPQSFGIVMKDGTMRAATAVVALGTSLLCVDPDDRHVRIAMNDVDRERTLQLNRQRGLVLHLPAGQ